MEKEMDEEEREVKQKIGDEIDRLYKVYQNRPHRSDEVEAMDDPEVRQMAMDIMRIIDDLGMSGDAMLYALCDLHVKMWQKGIQSPLLKIFGAGFHLSAAVGTCIGEALADNKKQAKMIEMIMATMAMRAGIGDAFGFGAPPD